MTHVVIPPREERLHRRRQLRQRRRIHFLQGCWRLTLTSSFLVGLTLLLRQPEWLIKDLSQVQVEGNQLLSDDQILSRLDLELPATLWQIQPQAIQKTLLSPSLSMTSETVETDPMLQAQSPFRAVLVQRQLIPPGLVVYVEEREPVALSTVNGIEGFVDAEGIWLSFANYPHLSSSPDLPQLQVLGWAAHAPEAWAVVLQAVHQSTLKIEVIDWQVANALTLKTEVGKVYLGPLSYQIDYQVQALNQMHDLQSHCQCSPSDIEYIDLSSPQSPTVQLTLAAAEQRWGAPLPLEPETP